MSFVKLPRKYPSKPQHGSRTGKGRRKQPVWDDTLSDLSVHRASAEELMRRKMVSTSHNLDAVKEDQFRQRISKAREQNSRTKHGQNAFLKEVLYDNVQLHEVLAKSDRMMAVVHDLFGDDPMKYSGAPNVTLAPAHSSINGSLPNMELGPSKLDILSESVMDKTALNEDSEDFEESKDMRYESAMDFERFQRLLELAAEEEGKQDSDRQSAADGLTRSTADSLLHRLAAKLGLSTDEEEADKSYEEDVVSPQPANNAMNDTIKVKKTKSRLTEEERAASPALQMHVSNTFSDMNDLRTVLDGLENNIGDYEKMIGRVPTVTTSSDDSLSGFTSRLVNAVSKITRYMRENEVRLRAESTLREQLHQDVLFLRQLVDTLTNDIMVTQEQYAALQSEFARYRKQTAEEISNIKHSLESAGIQLHKTVMPTTHLPQPAFATAQAPVGAHEHAQFSTAQQAWTEALKPPMHISRDLGWGEPQQMGTVLHNSRPDRQVLHQPPLEHPSQYQVLADDAMTTHNLTGGPVRHTAVRSHDRSTAVPLHVPQQSQSPKVPGTRCSYSAPNIPHPTVQPVASNEPMRATRSNAELHPTSLEAMPRVQTSHMNRHFNDVSHAETENMHAIQDSVLELKHAINREEVSLEQQIVELQKQHNDAQSKLHFLMQHDQAADQKVTAVKRGLVSPPISPITVLSEGDAPQQIVQRQPHQVHRGPVLSHTKEIRVSLPRMDMGDSSLHG